MGLGGNPTGSSGDIHLRVLATLPRRWWRWQAPVRTWIIGGIADSAAWCYSWIPYAALQSRIATATGMWLDLIAYDFLGRFLLRQGASDTIFRRQITSTVLQERVTRKGMTQILTNLLGISPTIIEPWNPGDCGAWSGKNQIVGHGGYGRVGAWGSLELPNQVFIRISRAGLGPAGVPAITGYGGYAGGYVGPNYPKFGAAQYIGSGTLELGVTDDVIENIITHTRPTGTIAWINIS